MTEFDSEKYLNAIRLRTERLRSNSLKYQLRLANERIEELEFKIKDIESLLEME